MSDGSQEHWADLVERGIISTQEAQVFWSFFQLEKPVTDSEMAQIMNFDDVYKVRRRRSELTTAKVLVAVEKRKCEITGVTATPHRVADHVGLMNFRALMATYKDHLKSGEICPTCGGTGKLMDISFLDD